MTIHHIDGYVWNPELWNLIAIKTKEHKKLHDSGKLVIGDWGGNLKILMSALELTKEQLPRKVQEKLGRE